MADKTPREEQLEQVVMTLGNALMRVLCLDTGGHTCESDTCPIIPCDDLRARIRHGIGVVASMRELLEDPVEFNSLNDFEVMFRANQMLGPEQMQQVIRGVAAEVARVIQEAQQGGNRAQRRAVGRQVDKLILPGHNM